MVTVINSTTLELSWDPPEEDGGSQITHYQVRASANGSTGWSTIATPRINLHTHSGLDPGSTWHYRVAAINADDEVGNYSTARGTTTGSTGVADAPRNLTATDVGAHHHQPQLGRTVRDARRKDDQRLPGGRVDG